MTNTIKNSRDQRHILVALHSPRVIRQWNRLFLQMPNRRYGAASVILQDSSFWITGGRESYDNELATSDIINLNNEISECNQLVKSINEINQ